MLQINTTTGKWRYFDATPESAAKIKAVTDRARETFESGILEQPYDEFHLRSFKVPSATREGMFSERHEARGTRHEVLPSSLAPSYLAPSYYDVCFYPDDPFCSCEYFKFRKGCRHIEAVKLFVPLQTIAILHAGIYTWSNDKKDVCYFTQPDGKARRFEAKHIISDDQWTLIIPAFYLDRHPILKEVA